LEWKGILFETRVVEIRWPGKAEYIKKSACRRHCLDGKEDIMDVTKAEQWSGKKEVGRKLVKRTPGCIGFCVLFL
jgi:hypothetical protein